MTKPTKGPWRVDIDGSFRTMIRGPKGRKIASTNMAQTIPKKGREETKQGWLKRVQDHNLSRARENEANARVIAAAPDMRDAIERMREEINIILENPTDLDLVLLPYKIYQSLINAAEKAKGR